jgi:hypothetical protein
MNANAYESPKVQLGCGTLILIAIIVAVFSQCGMKNELDSIHRQLDRIERHLDPGTAGGITPAATDTRGPESPGDAAAVEATAD